MDGQGSDMWLFILDGGDSEGNLRCEVANLQSRVAELEEELSLEKNRGEYET